MFKLVFLFVVLAFASAFAFNAKAASRPARMTMLFGSKKPAAKKAADVAPTSYKINEGTANKGTYVPEGLSKAQYEAFLKAESEKKAKKAAKFPLGKTPETLTEWMEKEAKNGFTGKALLSRHRLVKAKYEEFYTDESPV